MRSFLWTVADCTTTRAMPIMVAGATPDGRGSYTLDPELPPKYLNSVPQQYFMIVEFPTGMNQIAQSLAKSMRNITHSSPLLDGHFPEATLVNSRSRKCRLVEARVCSMPCCDTLDSRGNLRQSMEIHDLCYYRNSAGKECCSREDHAGYASDSS